MRFAGQRLTLARSSKSFDIEGKRTRTSLRTLRAIASLRAFPRVGFVVPRYKHSAVDRNRLKRRLRELASLELLPVLQTWTSCCASHRTPTAATFDDPARGDPQSRSALASLTLGPLRRVGSSMGLPVRRPRLQAPRLALIASSVAIS